MFYFNFPFLLATASSETASSTADHGTPPSSAPSSPKSTTASEHAPLEKDTPLSDRESECNSIGNSISVVPVKKEITKSRKRKMSIEEMATLNNNSLTSSRDSALLHSGDGLAGLRQQLSSFDHIGYMQQYWQQQHQYLNSSQYYQQQQQQHQQQQHHHQEQYHHYQQQFQQNNHNSS